MDAVSLVALTRDLTLYSVLFTADVILAADADALYEFFLPGFPVEEYAISRCVRYPSHDRGAHRNLNLDTKGVKALHNLLQKP